ncbi:NlpC/P60 family protein [Thermomonospora catenispora]|uniref:NlpC/P60 family protein n=1 Tax=Thermomonospora catenispora TaxID=2493090 RepID=UPI001F4F4FD4|nr:NlpC/P60 family protein [Thermomonospora catenispora]
MGHSKGAGLLAGTAVLVCTAVTVSSAALAEPVPERDAAERLGRAKARLAIADGRLEELSVRAETAVERYHGEVVKLHRAREEHRLARQRLADAQRRYREAQAELAAYAASAYRARTGGTPWTAVVAGRGGPQQAMERAAFLEMMNRHRAGAVQKVEAARNVAQIFQARATAALRAQQEATRRAREAKRAAEQAVARQRAVVAELRARRERAERLLAAARAEEAARARESAPAQGSAPHRRAAPSSQGTGRGLPGYVRGSHRGITVARAALRWLGTPYSWGGGNAKGPSYGIAHGAHIKGFDCSGLALYAWAKVGVRLDHWTGTQWTSGPHIPLDQLRPGDLVFFARDTADPDTIHHVGIYLARGQMVEAPYTGARVRISSIWRRGLIGATRPAG